MKIKNETKTVSTIRYTCEICGKDYANEKEALYCESLGLPEPHDYQVGKEYCYYNEDWGMNNKAKLLSFKTICSNQKWSSHKCHAVELQFDGIIINSSKIFIPHLEKPLICIIDLKTDKITEVTPECIQLDIYCPICGMYFETDNFEIITCPVCNNKLKVVISSSE